MKKHLTGPKWLTLLASEFELPYMQELQSFLLQEKRRGKKIYPQEDEIFSALNLTPFEKVKVVILGQDPYHGEGQAHGLAFSVKPGVKVPPSLVNIYKELESDLGLPPVIHGSLCSWARDGVLLLNTVLTVEDGRPGSHHQKGWEKFTDKIIELINVHGEHVVFILWGAPAAKKASQIDPGKHLIIQSPHPSPLSCYRGFYGSKPFSRANEFLRLHGIKPVDWKLN